MKGPWKSLAVLESTLVDTTRQKIQVQAISDGILTALVGPGKAQGHFMTSSTNVVFDLIFKLSCQEHTGARVISKHCATANGPASHLAGNTGSRCREVCTNQQTLAESSSQQAQARPLWSTLGCGAYLWVWDTLGAVRGISR